MSYTPTQLPDLRPQPKPILITQTSEREDFVNQPNPQLVTEKTVRMAIKLYPQYIIDSLHIQKAQQNRIDFWAKPENRENHEELERLNNAIMRASDKKTQNVIDSLHKTSLQDVEKRRVLNFMLDVENGEKTLEFPTKTLKPEKDRSNSLHVTDAPHDEIKPPSTTALPKPRDTQQK